VRSRPEATRGRTSRPRIVSQLSVELSICRSSPRGGWRTQSPCQPTSSTNTLHTVRRRKTKRACARTSPTCNRAQAAGPFKPSQQREGNQAIAT
jgi:hypothetical protein